MYSTLNEIGQKFRLNGELYSYDVITVGNINSTYKVTYAEARGRLVSYLFQRVNTHVFKNPEEIMYNIERVTSHIHETCPDQTTLRYYHTDAGLNYYVSGDGTFWRIRNYVDSVTFDSSEDLKVIEATGKAFGRFQMQLAGLDGSVLYETIPDFHNTEKRLAALFADAAKDPCGRTAEVQEELVYIASVREKAAELSVQFAEGKFPKRVTSFTWFQTRKNQLMETLSKKI